MPRNHDGLIRNPGHVCLGCANRPVNAAASGIINEREIPVPEGIGHMDDVSVGKFDRYIAVGVGGRIIFQRERRAIEMKRFFGSE